ncbi:hypothetical protein BaRGS_00001799, partial [Batillaria attramentaria]
MHRVYVYGMHGKMAISEKCGSRIDKTTSSGCSKAQTIQPARHQRFLSVLVTKWNKFFIRSCESYNQNARVFTSSKQKIAYGNGMPLNMPTCTQAGSGVGRFDQRFNKALCGFSPRARPFHFYACEDGYFRSIATRKNI